MLTHIKTPEALANFSPGLELATTLGTNIKMNNPERVSLCGANPFRVQKNDGGLNPGLKQPWVELANASGVYLPTPSAFDPNVLNLLLTAQRRVPDDTRPQGYHPSTRSLEQWR